MVGIRTQYELALALQNYESIRLVAAEALGGGKKRAAVEEDGAIQDMNELVRKFQMLGGKIGG